MKASSPQSARFRLEVPLDASGVEGFTPEQPVKVALLDQSGIVAAQTVKLDTSGRGVAAFALPAQPGSLRVVVGPATASDDEMQALQTLTLTVPARHWREGPSLKLPPVVIPAYYWRWWLRWCRTFTIRGRVLCPDGSPVPGAKVCAYDVDWWWWWSSKQLVGCDTTDASGAFSIPFRWCCGFWPWWWWRRRFWQLDPHLAELIVPVLQRHLPSRKLPLPDPKPDISLFRELLAEGGANPKPGAAPVEPAELEQLRTRLLKRLPSVPELERLHIWPWWPWAPWWDCTPDIVFHVTQDCPEPGTVIYDEGIFQARWNIPTELDVTLTASEKACCIPGTPDPRGDCIVISQVCDDLVATIGGNPGADPAVATRGYRSPGVVANGGDRPYGAAIPISGLFGDGVTAAYYEFQWSPDNVAWNDMPPAAAGGFVRTYWGPQLGGGPVGFHPVPFTFTPVSGRNVAMTREHFESLNDPASWGITRFWTSNRDLLMVWLTQNNFPDGLYYLRVRSWEAAGTDLTKDRILPLCDTESDNGVVIRIDNRLVGPASGHPASTPDHPCGPGTVHVCTMEPDTDFVQVRIDGDPAGVCTNVDATEGGSLEVDFYAYDPNGHLAYYTLIATYGENLAVDLLAAPGAALAPLAGTAVPAALQVGPGYGAARLQGAPAPTWAGGGLRLTVPNLRDVFPVSCCYQLELRAYKRTIVSCDDGFLPHSNLSEFSLGIVV